MNIGLAKFLFSAKIAYGFYLGFFGLFAPFFKSAYFLKKSRLPQNFRFIGGCYQMIVNLLNWGEAGGLSP
jgi:hypothetical protein